jgi:copper chaperone CopZ
MSVVTHKIVVGNIQTQEDKQKIDEALHDIWGIRQVEVDEKSGEVLIVYNEKAASLIDFKQAIADCGYELINDKGAVQQDT